MNRLLTSQQLSLEKTASMKMANREETFQFVVDQWYGSLQRMCTGYEFSTELRKELLQEILMAIWRSIPQFHENASLKTYIFRIAHNTAVTHVSRACKQSQFVKERLSDIDNKGNDSLDDNLEHREEVQMLQYLISQLRPLDRQIILLYLEEISQKEMAEITGLTLDNISTRVHRIKTSLAKQMDNNRRKR